MALLRCSVMSSIGGSQLAFLTITDGQSTNYAAPPADTRRVCACTFYLVFKEPDDCSPCDADRLEGNLSILLKRDGACQAPRPPLTITAELVISGRDSCRDGRAEKACFRRSPADRTGATHYTIGRSRCQPPASTHVLGRHHPSAEIAIALPDVVYLDANRRMHLRVRRPVQAAEPLGGESGAES